MNSALLEPDELAELVLELRQTGYDVGIEECFNAQRLMLALACFGTDAKSPSDLESYLGPLFCSTPAEQDRFSAVYQRWTRARTTYHELPSRQAAASASDQTVAPQRIWLSIQPWQYVAALGLIVLIGSVAWLVQLERLGRQWQPIKGVVVNASNSAAGNAVVSCGGKTVQTDSRGRFQCSFRLIDYPVWLTATKNSGRVETELPAPPTSRVTLRLPEALPTVANEVRDVNPAADPVPLKTYSHYYWWIFGTVIALPLLAFAGWLSWIYLPRTRLVRWRRGGVPKLDQLQVSGGQAGLFKTENFRRAAQELRRHRQIGSSELYAEKTIFATVERGGRFSPIYLLRQALPDYLILIDRANHRDQQARFLEILAQYLRAGDLFVETYTFNGDARLCFKEGDPAKPEALADLAARFPSHTMLVFTDARGLLSSLSGRLQPWTELFSVWQERALLVPEDAELDLYAKHLLTDSGFLVLPQSSDGMMRLAGTLRTGVLDRATLSGSADDYPPLLRDEPEHWLRRLPADPSSIGRLLMELRRYLRVEGFHWLGACAVYPQLNWNLTLYLGGRMHGGACDNRLLSRIVGLPWFRHGYMPDWLRSALILALPVSKRKEIREALEDLLLTALESPRNGFALEIASGVKRAPQPAWKKIALRNLLRTEAASSPYRDYVLLAFLAGRESKDLSPSLPRRVQSYFQRFTHPRRPWIPALAAVFVSCLGGATLWSLYPPGSPTPIALRLRLPSVPNALVPSPITSPAPVTHKNFPLSGNTYEIFGQPFTDIYFDWNSSRIRRSEIPKLQKIAAAMKNLKPGQIVIIEGNADETGTTEGQLGMGDRMATSVKDFLVSQGVSLDLLKTISYGKERPVCITSDDLCLQRNRNVHFDESLPTTVAN
jgi:outer membrane protein OmpA-like peptidoglycan-associated protein